MRRIFQSIFIIIFVLLSSHAVADVIYLTNGSTLEGIVVEENDVSIQLQLKSGKISINKDNIEKIEEKKFSIEESRGVIKSSSKNSLGNDLKQAKKKSKKRIAPSEGIGSIHTNNYANKTLEYYYYIPVSVKEGKKRKHPVLVVIPGLGARGETMIMPEIRDFAYDKKCILIAPSFMWDEKNWDSERSYQFPAVWSGQALLDIIKNVSKKNRLSTSKLYLFGHSAGAQFALRFSLWKPELCIACAAHGLGAPVRPGKTNHV
ncbi:hypothetical protein IID04_07495, partial [PVC group bacterium]|nr:hypothetical protein [PVC group bacterium]